MELLSETISTNVRKATTGEKLFNILSMSDEELVQRQKSRQKEKENKLIEEHIDDLPEEDKSEYQRLKSIEKLAKAIGKEVPENIKKKLEQYRNKVAKMIGVINEDGFDNHDSINEEISENFDSLDKLTKVGGKPVFGAKKDGKSFIIWGKEQQGDRLGSDGQIDNKYDGSSIEYKQ